MRTVLKDTALFFILAVFNQIFTGWFTIFSYLGSYIKFQNPEMMINNFYTCMIYLTLGTVLGNATVPFLFRNCSIKWAFLGTGFCSMLNHVGYLFCTNVPILYLNAVVSGILTQVFQLGSLAYFKAKYGDECVKYFGIISCGYPIGTMLVILLLKWMVNPENEQMDFNDFGEPIFSQKVSENIVNFMWVFGSGMMFVGTLLFFMLEPIEPRSNSIKPNKVELDDFLVNENRGEITERKSNRKLLNLNAFDQLFSFKFQFVFVCNILKTLSLEYVTDNYHYMAGFIVRNDSWTMNAFLFSTIFNLSSRFFSGFIWKKFGIYNCFILGFCFEIFNSFIYLIFGVHSPAVYTAMILYVRFFYSLNYLWCNMTMFTIYNIEEALQMAKFFDLYLLAVILIDNLFNDFFVWNHVFTNIFIAFLALDVAGLLFFLLNREKFLKQIFD